MPKKSYSLSELAEYLHAEAPPLELEISGIADLRNATAEQISFYVDTKQRDLLATTRAGAVLLHPKDQHLYTGPTVLCEVPYLAFAKLTHLFSLKNSLSHTAIHPSAIIAADAQIGQGVSIGAHTVVETACKIGDRVMIAAHCTIGSHCNIGTDTRLKAHVVIADHSCIGKHVIIQPGAVIGGDGFGFVPNSDGWVKIEHLGNVKIGDNVEIGANTTIDRATLGSTVIGDGVKIDNLVHISHNDVIGDRTAIAACTGIAGSTTIGKDCKIGGASMINGHIHICDGTTITPATRIHQSITKPGHYSSGLLAVEHREWLRNSLYFKRLYKLIDKFNKLDKSGKLI